MKKMVLIRRGIPSFLLKGKNFAWNGKKVVLNKPHILNIRNKKVTRNYILATLLFRLVTIIYLIDCK